MLENNDVLIIEDFSQAFGATFQGKFLGTLGDFGICSTSSTKTFDTYGGALVFTNDALQLDYLKRKRSQLTEPKRITLLKKILKNLVRNIATNKLIFNILTFPIIILINSRNLYQVGKYTGDRSLLPLAELPSGWFEAPCAFQAKVGIRELKLQSEKDQKRIAIAERYSMELNLLGPRGKQSDISVYWQYISIESSAIEFRDFLNRRFIDCSTTSLIKLSQLKEYGLAGFYLNTKILYENGVYLPCYHQLTDKEQSRVIEAVRAFHEKK